MNNLPQRPSPSDWFESVYARNKQNGEMIPWARMRPNFNLLAWLETHPTNGQGQTALVTGCGLGDDAEELAALGFAVTAFDISATAIELAQDRWQATTVRYEVADLFNLPSTYQQAFDFVLDAYTLQSLPLYVRQSAIESVASTVATGGKLLVIAIGREDDVTDPSGPPWALSRQELSHFNDLGLRTLEWDAYQDQSDVRYPQGVLRFRAVYTR